MNHVRARGKAYFYYHPRRGTDGASGALRLPGTPQDAEFWKEYRRLHGEGELAGQPRTIGALIDAYLKSPEFERLSPKTGEAYSSAGAQRPCRDTGGRACVPRPAQERAVKLAEAGCTDAEIAAITGQTRQMVEHYTKGVDQKRLAVAAMRKWEAGGDRNEE